MSTHLPEAPQENLKESPILSLIPYLEPLLRAALADGSRGGELLGYWGRSGA